MIAFLVGIIVSYLAGSICFARIIVKSFRSLRLVKIGQGFTDAENVYQYLSKPLGTLIGTINIAKVILWLSLLRYLMLTYGASHITLPMGLQKVLFVWGFAFLIGDCLPLYYNFKGGRGIFTYLGFLGFFAPILTSIVALLAFLVSAIWRQHRAAQYMIVMLPPLFSQMATTFFHYYFKNSHMASYFADSTFPTQLIFAGLFVGVLNFIVLRRRGEL